MQRRRSKISNKDKLARIRALKNDEFAGAYVDEIQKAEYGLTDPPDWDTPIKPQINVTPMGGEGISDPKPMLEESLLPTVEPEPTITDNILSGAGQAVGDLFDDDLVNPPEDTWESGNIRGHLWGALNYPGNFVENIGRGMNEGFRSSRIPAGERSQTWPYLADLGDARGWGESGKHFWNAFAGNYPGKNPENINMLSHIAGGLPPASKVFQGAKSLYQNTPFIRYLPEVMQSPKVLGPAYLEAAGFRVAEALTSPLAKTNAYKKAAELVASHGPMANINLKKAVTSLITGKKGGYTGSGLKEGQEGYKGLLKQYIYGKQPGFKKSNIPYEGLDNYSARYGKLDNFLLDDSKLKDSQAFLSSRSYFRDGKLNFSALGHGDEMDKVYQALRGKTVPELDYVASGIQNTQMQQKAILKAAKRKGRIDIPSSQGRNLFGQDDIAGHMKYINYNKKTGQYSLEARDIWKFAPDDFVSRWNKIGGPNSGRRNRGGFADLENDLKLIKAKRAKDIKAGKKNIVDHDYFDGYLTDEYIKPMFNTQAVHSKASMLEKAGKPFVLTGKAPLKIDKSIEFMGLDDMKWKLEKGLKYTFDHKNRKLVKNFEDSDTFIKYMDDARGNFPVSSKYKRIYNQLMDDNTGKRLTYKYGGYLPKLHEGGAPHEHPHKVADDLNMSNEQWEEIEKINKGLRKAQTFISQGPDESEIKAQDIWDDAIRASDEWEDPKDDIIGGDYDQGTHYGDGFWNTTKTVGSHAWNNPVLNTLGQAGRMTLMPFFNYLSSGAQNLHNALDATSTNRYFDDKGDLVEGANWKEAGRSLWDLAAGNYPPSDMYRAGIVGRTGSQAPENVSAPAHVLSLLALEAGAIPRLLGSSRLAKQQSINKAKFIDDANTSRTEWGERLAKQNSHTLYPTDVITGGRSAYEIEHWGSKPLKLFGVPLKIGETSTNPLNIKMSSIDDFGSLAKGTNARLIDNKLNKSGYELKVERPTFIDKKLQKNSQGFEGFTLFARKPGEKQWNKLGEVGLSTGSGREGKKIFRVTNYPVRESDPRMGSKYWNKERSFVSESDDIPYEYGSYQKNTNFNTKGINAAVTNALNQTLRQSGFKLSSGAAHEPAGLKRYLSNVQKGYAEVAYPSDMEIVDRAFAKLAASKYEDFASMTVKEFEELLPGIGKIIRKRERVRMGEDAYRKATEFKGLDLVGFDFTKHASIDPRRYAPQYKGSSYSKLHYDFIHGHEYTKAKTIDDIQALTDKELQLVFDPLKRGKREGTRDWWNMVQRNKNNQGIVDRSMERAGEYNISDFSKHVPDRELRLTSRDAAKNVIKWLRSDEWMKRRIEATMKYFKNEKIAKDRAEAARDIGIREVQKAHKNTTYYEVPADAKTIGKGVAYPDAKSHGTINANKASGRSTADLIDDFEESANRVDIMVQPKNLEGVYKRSIHDLKNTLEHEYHHAAVLRDPDFMMLGIPKKPVSPGPQAAYLGKPIEQQVRAVKTVRWLMNSKDRYGKSLWDGSKPIGNKEYALIDNAFKQKSFKDWGAEGVLKNDDYGLFDRLSKGDYLELLNKAYATSPFIIGTAVGAETYKYGGTIKGKKKYK